MIRFLIALVLLLACPGFAGADGASISIQPLGTVDRHRIEVMKTGLEQAYGKKVLVLKPVPLPESAWYAPRGRYRAEKILDHLGREPDPKQPVLIAITAKDISTTKGDREDFGIYGLGELDGRVCVVSTFRMGAGGVDEATQLERLRKIAIHEIGHVAGLLHCKAPGCVMQDIEASIRKVDRESGAMCPGCKEAALNAIAAKAR
ncbi:matrixin family metalloprotease [Luteolibacter marinus]|uniref:matrixin family metalloprotease n=1 Tax=Luteolibacter marinus TaxID=2776705 RepID=UPI001866AA75|nr:matrixin family metalloprotease [Luteolibacter marinus]